MAMLKNITEVEINKDLFGYCKLTRSFTGMASDFKNKNLYARIYDDAADVGFFLKNPLSGTKILFVFSGETYDGNVNDPEVASFEFSAFCPAENPAELMDLRVSLFND